MSKAELCSQGDVRVAIQGVELVLLADRGVYWPQQNTLFIADTHFGKEASFQRQGVAAPRSGMTDTLRALDRMLTITRADHLVVLGDLFHARCSLVSEVRDEFTQFINGHSNLRWTLVEGNHDIKAGRLPASWQIDVVKPGYQLSNLILHHQPSEEEAVDAEANVNRQTPSLELCGHLHPAIIVGNHRERVGRFPCFWLNNTTRDEPQRNPHMRLVLPALGSFTGSLSIRPASSDSVWLIAEGQVLRFA